MREQVKARFQRALGGPFLAMYSGATLMGPFLSPLERVVDRSVWHREAMIWSVADVLFPCQIKQAAHVLQAKHVVSPG